MSATTSAATRRCFGIQRVCQVWERSRSALYARLGTPPAGHTTGWAHHRLGTPPAGHTTGWAHHRLGTPPAGHTTGWAHHRLGTPPAGHTTGWAHHRLGTPPAGHTTGWAHHRLGAWPARRGPPPRQSDAQLLAAIRTDLARSPFHGEGHRKVPARLRILDGIRVARTRVLCVMRAHGLLSPHRGRQGAAKTHDGRVITQAPNVMWGTDGVRVFTLDDGWGWIFAAVEHWNAECVGWHVCKVGSRFAALDPIAQGLERR